MSTILADLEHDASADLARKLGSLTVADVVRLYYDRRKVHLELSTRSRYENVLKKYVFPGLGDTRAKDVAATPVLLEDWLATVPWGSARKALEVLGPAFRMAYDNGLIPSNPVAKIRRPKRPDRKRKKEIPTPDEVEKIVIAAYEEDIWWGYYVELTATLGLRRSETAALRWEDFVFPERGAKYGIVHIRRVVGKKDGGIYLKTPKSGLERELLVSRSLFDGLGAFDGATGWLFPGREHQAAQDRFLLLLLERGGVIECASGRAGAQARIAIGVNSATFSLMVRPLVEKGLLQRDANARRTFRLALTDAGRVAANDLARQPLSSEMPIHPDTASHHFEELVRRVGLETPSGRQYTLHSLRHYRATHLYNASKDWVQVAKYLGHTSPAITMDLYANNVVSATQELLADSAVQHT